MNQTESMTRQNYWHIETRYIQMTLFINVSNGSHDQAAYCSESCKLPGM